MAINSKSYIIVTCAEDAEPRFNRLQLRTKLPTYIELKPGKNILTVEDYPDLKNGFRQLENCKLDNEIIGDSDYCGEYNGGEIISIDLSHFDASEMTTMDHMFEHMESLTEINFGDILIHNVTSMSHAFDMAGIDAKDSLMETLDLMCVDFSEVTDTSYMLWGGIFKKINLSGTDFSKVTNAEGMFGINWVEELILDDVTLPDAVIEALCANEDITELKTVSLCFCDKETSEKIINELSKVNNDIEFKFEGNKYTRDYRIVTDENGDTEVQFIKLIKLPSVNKVDGKPLIKDFKKQKWAVVPYGVSTVTKRAFEDCADVVGIIIPDSVTSIGNNAFKGCKNLQYVNIPSSVRTLGSGIFSDCCNLKRLYIPNSVEKCGSLFSHSSRVGTLHIPMRLVYSAGLDSAEIDNLIIGMDDDDRFSKLDLASIEPQYLNAEKWPSIFFEERGISQTPFDEIASIDGMIIGLETFEDENGYDDEYATLYTLPSHVVAIPNEVERLGANSVVLRTLPLYIPSSVKSIDEEAFWDTPKYRLPWLVTPAANYENLKEILPASLRNIRIITI